MVKIKKQKTKDKGKRLLIIAIVVAVLIIAAMLALFAFRDSKKIISNTDEKPNTIQLSIDENNSDINNLKEIYFADVYVINGKISWKALDDSRSIEIELLKKALTEINEKETLPLIMEQDPGTIQVREISKDDSHYIYAVADYFGNYYGFSTNLVETNVMLPDCNVLIAGENNTVIC